MANRRQQILSVLGLTVVMLTAALLIFTLAVPMGTTKPEVAEAQIDIRPKARVRVAQKTDKAEKAEPAPADTSPATIQDQWQGIYIDDQRIGFSHTKAEKRVENKQEIIRTVTNEKMKIKRSGDLLEINILLTTEEKPDGSLLSYDLQIKNPPSTDTRAVGQVNGDRLDIETTIGGATRKNSLVWSSDIKSPAYQDRLLRESRLQPRQVLHYKTLSPEYSRIATVSVAVDDYRDVKLLDNTRVNLLKVRVTSSLVPDTPTYVYLDNNGEVRKTESQIIGKKMASYAVSSEEALKELTGEGFDIGIGSYIKIDPPLGGAHRTKRAVYRITNPGKDPSKSFVEGPTQSIKKIDDNTIELTVTAIPIPREPKRVPGPAEYLQSTRFLQSDDPHVVAHARAAANGRIDHGVLAEIMERYVNRKLAKKHFSTAMASAAEVAETLSGDCTEHAVLLAAMLRARQIPSRIAVGLVYVDGPNAFGGHMWTEAWMDGQWIPLDATLGRGGIGAAHLKMADSNFADDAPAPFATFLPLIDALGTMKIEVLSAE